MRKLAQFEDERRARILTDALLARGIENELRAEHPGAHTVWVLDERKVEQARALLARFDTDPDAPEIQAAARRVQELRRAEAREAKRRRPQVIDARATFRRESSRGPVTTGLILISLMVTLVTELQPGSPLRSILSIASLRVEDGHLVWLPGFAEVRAGQLWRLVTPIFLHGDFLHLLFNMWWLLDFGATLEHRIGSLRLLGLVLLSAALSNAAQLQWGGGPGFGGTSGVVYALFGYLWIRGQRDPSFGLQVRPDLTAFFLLWLALGVSGVLDVLVGPVANYCHVGGLAVGAGWGYLASMRRRAPPPPRT